jgi:CRISPR-associated protein Cmr5
MYVKINIEKLLEPANNALIHSEIVVIENNIPKDVIKEYDGYISGFGATVINMGIKSTLAFYMKDGEKLKEVEKQGKSYEKPYRARVVRALAKILEEVNEEKMFNKIIEIKNVNQLHQQTQKIIDASVALKLMIRTYRFTNKIQNTDEL